MTSETRNFIRAWYGKEPVEAIAKRFGMSETAVRYRAAIVEKLGTRTQWANHPDRRKEVGL